MRILLFSIYVYLFLVCDEHRDQQQQVQPLPPSPPEEVSAWPDHPYAPLCLQAQHDILEALDQASRRSS